MSNIILKTVSLFPVYVLFSSSSFAQGDLSTIDESVGVLGGIIDALIPIAFALAVVYFFYTLATYILKPDNENAKKSLWYGIVVLFIITSIWGIVALLQGVTGTDEGNIGDITVPRVEVR